MRPTIILILLLSAMGCSETQLVDYWKNPDVETYSPEKVLVIGLTSNAEARAMFEIQLKTALEERGFRADRSATIKMLTTQNEKLTEEQLNDLESYLLEQGYDTILLSSIVGTEDKIAYKTNYDGFDETYKRFKEDYLRYQDAFYNPDYYEQYTIYHAETAMYCICPAEKRELIWKGYINITDPRVVSETVDQYVNLVIVALEELNLLEPIATKPKLYNEPVYH
ncbi:hypothetical protein J4050_04415 [Winogradskyella sp. DF17]|uniref:DUF4136 domain-containing protein n=1 Tax=Winogradskyella pelagia TaxID=2819984 RepID=A0ABS3T262_9FLAO|nr:hypothetical protein [Winogradskyella sp. DF17]MBO3115976.1 hypothetical protein [Winogradskyella sp. DF17]